MLCVLTQRGCAAGLQLAVNLKWGIFAESLAKGQTDSDVEYL